MGKPDSLSIVLAVRRRAEEAGERALAQASLDVFQAEATVASLQAEQRNAEADCCGEAGSLAHGTELQLRAQRVAALRHLCEAARQTLLGKLDARTQQQAAYLQARQGREVIDTLLKQRAQTELLTRQRRENSRADDLFLGRMGRRSSENDAAADWKASTS